MSEPSTQPTPNGAAMHPDRLQYLCIKYVGSGEPIVEMLFEIARLKKLVTNLRKQCRGIHRNLENSNRGARSSALTVGLLASQVNKRNSVMEEVLKKLRKVKEHHNAKEIQALINESFVLLVDLKD